MFTELDLGMDFENNFDEMITRSLNILCSDSMFILQNNSKVLRFLTDEQLSKELDMLVQSVSMALKRQRFELFQNIILGLKGQVHKLAALEIKYFDEHATLLRSDMCQAFMPKKFKEHAFISPSMKELFEIFNETAKLSPTNAAFALRSSFEVGEQNFVENVMLNAGLTQEFVCQIHKRYHDNFGMTIEEDLKNIAEKSGRNDAIKQFLLKAM